MKMNKFTLTLTLIYILIIAYFSLFNWNVFMLELDVNLGVQVVQFPLIAGIFLLGFIMYMLLWLNLSVHLAVIKKKLSKSTDELNKFRSTKESLIENKLENLTSKLDEIKKTIETEVHNKTIQ